MRALVFIALAGFLVPAWAQNTNVPLTISQISARAVEAKWSVENAINSVWSTAGSAPRTVVPAVTPAGSVVLTSNYKGPSPLVGQTIDVAVKRTVPWAAVSKAVAKSLPLISTALAIKEIADAIRCREGPGGTAECDAGTPETQVNVYSCFVAGVTRTGGSPVAACNAAAAASSSVTNQGTYTTTITRNPGSCTGMACSGSVTSACTWNVGGESCGLSNGTWDGTASSSSQLACPAVVVNGVTLYPVKGPDGKCMTNIYSPASEDAVATKAETWGDKTKAPNIVGDLNAAGKPIDHPFPEIDPVPDSVVGPRETTTAPDGSTTVRDTVWDLAPSPSGYGWMPRVITKDYPPGAVIPPPGAVTDGTTTVGAAPKEDPITCGLPNTPPCKIDETGTPTTGTIPTAEVDTSKGDALTKLTDIGTIQAPAWTWSFALPTACSPVTVGPFLTQSVTVDLCAYQGLIHDLAALIWVSFTVWACVGIAGRAFSAG